MRSTKIIIKNAAALIFHCCGVFLKIARARKALSADKARLVPTIPLA